MEPKLPLSLPPPPSHSPSSSYTSFPILAISILGILTTCILLLSYYIFVTKCCRNWRHPPLLLLFFQRRSGSRRHSFTQHTTTHHHNNTIETRGLGLSTINSIPTFRYSAKPSPSVLVECAVCLSDFQHQQLLRLLPNCSHAFHIDCIDTWLQANDNCPLCRSQIQPYLSSPPFLRPPQPTEAVIEIDSPIRVGLKMKGESKGDEWIDTREKVQPIRRSFSMDSCNDRQLYVSVQEILRRNPGLVGEGGRNLEGSSSSSSSIAYGGGSGRIQRSFFSFGRSSTRSASVLPLSVVNLERTGFSRV